MPAERLITMKGYSADGMQAFHGQSVMYTARCWEITAKTTVLALDNNRFKSKRKACDVFTKLLLVK